MRAFEVPEAEQKEHEELPELSVQERVLAYGMLMGDPEATVSYDRAGSGAKVIKRRIAAEQFDDVAEKFAGSPQEMLARLRENITAIASDERMDDKERADRIRRYVDAMVGLQVKLDRRAFPSTEDVRVSVPDYLPDGLVDMGAESGAKDAASREREMILLDKEALLERAKPFLREVLGEPFTGKDKAAIDKYLVQRIAQYVFESSPYDKQESVIEHARSLGRPVGLSEVLEKKMALCRHIALYAQTLMQATGVDSRLLKCRLKMEDGDRDWRNHASNLIRIKGEKGTKWMHLDPTIPDYDAADGVRFASLADLPEDDIDVNRHAYEWNVDRKYTNRTFRVRSRNDMHWFIRRPGEPAPAE